MQGYSESFARIYNLRWASFAFNAAPRLRAFYETRPNAERTLLDLCCGTGQLALHFLENGYHVTGLDLSDAMLAHARAATAEYIVAGQARFVQGDAANFHLAERFGLVVSTFDSLNHLPGMDALRGCFRSVWNALEDDGLFIFDLNTTEGLRRWVSISVEDTPELMLVMRALFDESAGRAYTRISGFVPAGDGRYERFEETAYETAFPLAQVRAELEETGFSHIRFVSLQNLAGLLENPERETRVFILAEKQA
jgi:SAM-dependent methyltransferase